MAQVPREIIPEISFVYGPLSNHETPLVVGLVGSHAYGLDTSDSDKDYLGVHYVATEKLFGFGGNELASTTRIDSLPDFSSHEILKFIRLATGGNPTVSELLWLNNYEYISPEFQELVDMREAFLSAKRIRKSYTGYVYQQAKRLLSRIADGKDGFDPDLKKRTRKHARHCFRLLMQYETLATTGVLDVDVSTSRDEIFAAGDLAESDPDMFYSFIEEKISYLDQLESVLPKSVDQGRLEEWLVGFRKGKL